MGITAYFYQFDKKANSTKLPVLSPGDIAMTVELKKVTNLFTPSLVINPANYSFTNPMKFTYCHIPDFDRYYFITGWSWVLGLWECTLEVDVLASFKTAIGNTTAYVLRSASQYDPDVVDNKYPAKKVVSMDSTHRTPNTSPWSINLYNASITEGFFVVSIANNDANSIGAISHYAFSARAMQEFMHIMYDAPSWMNITDTSISTDLQKMMLNPIQYVTNCMWIPTGFSTGGAVAVTQIPYGWWKITLVNNTAYRINVNNLTRTFSMDFPTLKHPQYDSAKRKWLQLSPYTNIAFRFEPFGMFSLDSTKLADYDRIRCVVWLDSITGVSNLTVYPCIYDGGAWLAGEAIYTTSAQVGVPISVAQMSIDMNRLTSASTWGGAAALSVASSPEMQEQVSGTVQAVANAIKQPKTKLGQLFAFMTNSEYRMAVQNGTLNPDEASSAWNEAASSIMQTVKQVVPEIGNAALAASGVCTSKGVSGSFAMLTYPPEMIYYFQHIVDTDDAHNGIPLCKSVKINTLSGFVVCANGGDFAPNCNPAEKQAVIALMEAGFYYE